MPLPSLLIPPLLVPPFQTPSEFRVRLRAAVPKSTVPLRVISPEELPLPKAVVAVMVTLLASVRALPSELRSPPERVSGPVPKAASFPKMRKPFPWVVPPEKELAEVSVMFPLPVLVRRSGCGGALRATELS